MHISPRIEALAAKLRAEAPVLYVVKVFVLGRFPNKPVEECWGVPICYASDFALGVVASWFECELDEVTLEETDDGDRLMIAGGPVAFYTVEAVPIP